MRKTQRDRILEMLLTVDALREGGEQARNLSTPNGIAKVLGVMPESANRSLRKLRDIGEAHVHDWTEGHHRMAIWVRGKGEDALRPLTTKEEKAEYHRLYLQRYRQEQGDRLTDALSTSSRHRTMSTIERARQAPQSWFAALEAA